MLRGALVALLFTSGCLDVPGFGGSDDPDEDASPSPADAGSLVVDAGGSRDATSCGVEFSVAHVDLVHAAPNGGDLAGMALLLAEADPVALAPLQVDSSGDPQFDVQLALGSDKLVPPGKAHGGLAESAASQIALVIDPEQWEVTNQPVLTLAVGSEVTLPSVHDFAFSLLIGQQRAEMKVRVRYNVAYTGVVAQRAAVAESLCVE